MAGVGFELKKLFEKKGITAKVRAYGYAGLVISGPMILGVLLLLGIMYLANRGGATRMERELLISMFTYALLFSLIASSVLSVLTVRYVADMIYTGNTRAILPSFYGSSLLTLFFGGAAYGIFLVFSGISLSYQILSFLFFLTLLVVWTEMNFLTAISDYKNVLLTFAGALILMMLTGFVLIQYTETSTTLSLLLSAWLAYGLMAVRYFNLIVLYFPKGIGSSLRFLKWIDKYPTLLSLGLLLHLGLFGHLIIMWNSPLEIPVQGWFKGAPTYDVSALIAIISILITTVTFVTATETKFHPLYKKYFSLLNGSGNIVDIETTEQKMIQVLDEEMGYLVVKQVIATILFISVGTIILPRTALGFTSDMLGIYRMLCVGYALFAIGNSMFMILLYFEDNKGAFRAALIFAVSTNLFTFLFKDLDSAFYGFGFILGSGVFALYTATHLRKFIDELKFHVLAKRPIHSFEKNGRLSRFINQIEAREITNKPE